MSTKADIINEAFEELRISGITNVQRPGDTVLALRRLEDMMEELRNGRDFDVDYNFEASPDVNSNTNVDGAYRSVLRYSLAIRLIPAFNKPVPEELKRLSKGAMNGALAALARCQVRQVPPSRRMPRGRGNYRTGFGGMDNFYHPESQPPTTPSLNTLYVGETQDYEEDFTAWLGDNTISTVEIDVDPRLTLDSSSNSAGVVSYTVTAGGDPGTGVWQYLKITVTDSAGRVNIRLLNFQVLTPPEVP